MSPMHMTKTCECLIICQQECKCDRIYFTFTSYNFNGFLMHIRMGQLMTKCCFVIDINNHYIILFI